MRKEHKRGTEQTSFTNQSMMFCIHCFLSGPRLYIGYCWVVAHGRASTISMEVCSRLHSESPWDNRVQVLLIGQTGKYSAYSGHRVNITLYQAQELGRSN